MTESLLVSAAVVGLAEIGDRTQFLSLIMACCYRRSAPVISGIFCATLLCNGLAAYGGETVSTYVTPTVLKWLLGLSFIGMAAWILMPEEHATAPKSLSTKRTAFTATFVAFLAAEMGDKTQIATAILSARFGTILPVVVGSTAGMMITNIPIVLLAKKHGKKLLASRKLNYLAAATLLLQAGLVLSGYKLF